MSIIKNANVFHFFGIEMRLYLSKKTNKTKKSVDILMRHVSLPLMWEQRAQPARLSPLTCFHEHQEWESQITLKVLGTLKITLNALSDNDGYPSSTSSQGLSIKPLAA